jgi:hypothetical protein
MAHCKLLAFDNTALCLLGAPPLQLPAAAASVAALSIVACPARVVAGQGTHCQQGVQGSCSVCRRACSYDSVNGIIVRTVRLLIPAVVCRRDAPCQQRRSAFASMCVK